MTFADILPIRRPSSASSRRSSNPPPLAPGTARDLQYLLAGLYIARNSDVLIALWDGTLARGVGGTADIVEFRRTGRLDTDPATRDTLARAPDPFRIADAPLDAPQTGLVYHIPVSRSNDAPSTDPATGGWLIPSSYAATPDLRARFVRSSMSTLRHRDELNREGADYRARRGGRIASSDAMLTAGQTTPSTRDASAPRALANTRAAFAIADALAIEHQKSIYRTMIALFGMIAVATISLVMRNIATSDDARRICLAGLSAPPHDRRPRVSAHALAEEPGSLSGLSRDRRGVARAIFLAARGIEALGVRLLPSQAAQRASVDSRHPSRLRPTCAPVGRGGLIPPFSGSG